MAYHALKLLQLPTEIINEILSFLAPTAELLKKQRLMHELNFHFVKYDIIHSVPFLRKLGVPFRFRKWQVMACLYHDLNIEPDDIL
jgi:hypothetical protein